MRIRRSVRQRSYSAVALAGACVVLFTTAVVLELRFYAKPAVPVQHSQITEVANSAFEYKAVQVSASPTHALSSPQFSAHVDLDQPDHMSSPAIILYCFNRCCRAIMLSGKHGKAQSHTFSV